VTPILNQKLHDRSITRAKRSSSEALLKRSARYTNEDELSFDSPDILPDLISSLLADGRSVRFSAPGGSMHPTICDGDVITVMPVEPGSIAIGDIILYRHSSGVAAHRVIRLEKENSTHAEFAGRSREICHILRGDAAIVFDEPVSAEQILGKVTRVERNGRKNNPYAIKTTICYKARRLAVRFKAFIFSNTIGQILSCLFLLCSAPSSLN
jgi:signal peptidase I